MKTHFTKGEKVQYKSWDGNTYTGVVDSQKGTMLRVKWDHIGYRPQDTFPEIDYREIELCSK